MDELKNSLKIPAVQWVSAPMTPVLNFYHIQGPSSQPVTHTHIQTDRIRILHIYIDKNYILMFFIHYINTYDYFISGQSRFHVVIKFMN